MGIRSCCHKVEAGSTNIQEALDEYAEAKENPEDHFYSLHEFKVIDD